MNKRCSTTFLGISVVVAFAFGLSFVLLPYWRHIDKKPPTMREYNEFKEQTKKLKIDLDIMESKNQKLTNAFNDYYSIFNINVIREVHTYRSDREAITESMKIIWAECHTTEERFEKLEEVYFNITQKRKPAREIIQIYNFLLKKGLRPLIDGQVVGVRGSTMVINQGSKNGVQKGYMFGITRGAKFIGKAKVAEVYDTQSVLYIDHSYDQLDQFRRVIPVLKHDAVSTKK